MMLKTIFHTKYIIIFIVNLFFISHEMVALQSSLPSFYENWLAKNKIIENLENLKWHQIQVNDSHQVTDHQFYNQSIFYLTNPISHEPE